MMYTTSSTSRAIVAEFSEGYNAVTMGYTFMNRAIREYLRVTETEKIAVIVELPIKQVKLFQEYADRVNRENTVKSIAKMKERQRMMDKEQSSLSR